MKIYKLGDLLLEKNQGVNTTTEKVSYSEVGKPVLRAQNIGEFKIDFQDLTFVDDVTFARIRPQCKPKKGDVLYTNIGSQLGYACVYASDENTMIAWNVLKMLPKSELILPEYLAYYLNDSKFRAFIRGINSSSTMPFVSGSTLETLEISVPDINIQKKIINVIEPITNKIELNNKINQTIESLAKALYKEWFIDFGPVKARAEGKKAFGIDDETATHFPDCFEESEHGQIPKEWNIGTLRDISNVIGGYAFKGSDFSETGHPVIKIKNISESLDVGLDDVDYVPDEIASKVPKFHLKDGALVMAMTGATVGKFGLVIHRSGLTPVLNQRVALLESKDNGISFLLSALLATNAYEQIVNRAEGSAQPNISADGIMDSKLLIPPQKLRDSFGILIDPLFDLWKENKRESATLKNLRDMLLPKLISGEIDLKEISVD